MLEFYTLAEGNVDILRLNVPSVGLPIATLLIACYFRFSVGSAGGLVAACRPEPGRNCAASKTSFGSEFCGSNGTRRWMLAIMVKYAQHIAASQNTLSPLCSYHKI